MSDAQIVTIAVAVIVPVSTLLGGIFFQDHRATALRAELADTLKEIREDIREIRKRLDEIERRGKP